MKTLRISRLLIGSLTLAWTATTINSANRYAYGANLGWMDWRGGFSELKFELKLR